MYAWHAHGMCTVCLGPRGAGADLPPHPNPDPNPKQAPTCLPFLADTIVADRIAAFWMDDM